MGGEALVEAGEYAAKDCGVSTNSDSTGKRH